MGALDHVKLHYVESVNDVIEFLAWLDKPRAVLAIDTETTGLMPWKDHVRLIQFGDRTEGWTFRWDRWGGVVKEVFDKYDGDYVFHNAKFDLAVLARWCDIIIPSARVHDTAIMARILEPTSLRGLKPLAEMYVDRNAGVGQAMLEKAMAEGKWNWETIPYDVPAYTVYAAMDTVLTAHLFDILYPKVMTLCPGAYDLEREFAAVVQKIEARGSMVDKTYTEQSFDSLTSYMNQVEEWCMNVYGVKPGSNQAIVQVLINEGISFVKTTDKGAFSLDADVLEGIDHPLAQSVLKRRQTQKVANTYLRNFLEMSDDDMIIRPRMDAQGTVTGRMSMELFQTLPRRSEDNPLAIIVRNCIVPRPDNTIMLCDWDQIEMRILAHLSNDPGLAQAFTQGDFFLNIVREIFDDPTIVRSDPRRQTTKNAMYGKVYGAGIAKFSATAGIDERAGAAFMAKLDERFPGMDGLKHQVEDIATMRQRLEGRPYVTSPLTGQPYFPKREDKIYALVNYLIQGTAASILKKKVVELDNVGVGDYLTLLVHDEVIADVPNEHVHDVAHAIKGVMNDDTLLNVPVTASLSLASRWGSKGDLKLEDFE